MPADCIQLSTYLLAESLPDRQIAYHDEKYFSVAAFRSTVKYWVGHLEKQPDKYYALFTEDAYPFAVLFMALLHAGKHIWLPGNNRPGTAQQLLTNKCQLIGDWAEASATDYGLSASTANSLTLKPINPLEPQITIFTSGSTGKPKAIKKNLHQFQLEINTLEQHWGHTLGHSEILSTVSHQHIYGLLFRILWPLFAGRCFHSSIYLNPELLVNHQQGNACWVASPAHLKRLDNQSPWHKIAKLNAVFSSGGDLSEVAREQIEKYTALQVIEIYGSSETGGIGWRQAQGAWTLFSGMTLQEIDGKCQLHSPYLLSQTGYLLDDELSLLANNQFTLHGRTDRIVKVEEKRLSLTALEQRIQTLTWVNEAVALVISKQRDVVAMVITLNQDEFQQLPQIRQQLIKQLRNLLKPWFEAVVLPRKWLFANTLPITAQSKIDLTLLSNLLSYDEQKLPQPLSLEITETSVKIGLNVSPNLIYFPDHFAGFPILPGVVQLAWVEYFGKLFFEPTRFLNRFSHLETIKFLQVIRPGDKLILTLNWKAHTQELHFNFSSMSGPCSSGRMVYTADIKALTQ